MFIYIPNTYLQDRETFLQRRSKPSRISFELKYFVKRRNITIKLIPGSLLGLTKLSFTIKGLHEIDLKSVSGVIFVFHRISFLKSTYQF